MNPESSANDRFVDRLARNPALDAAADVIQPRVQALLNADNSVSSAVNDALHGTWIGHPLHPLLTDIPIGAWTVGAIADVLALCGNDRAAYAGDIATTIGVVGASGAALAGWADWSDTKDDVRRLGIAHVAMNATALSLYLVSLALRRAHQRGAATAAALLGYAFVGAGGYLGGEMSFGQQIGVKHTSIPVEPPMEFVRVAAVADVPATGVVRVDAGGIPVLLSRIGNEINAIGAACTHRGAPLDEGTRENDCIRCPWHGSLFALDDGEAIEGPATFPQPAFDTRVVDGAVEIRVRGSSSS